MRIKYIYYRVLYTLEIIQGNYIILIRQGNNFVSIKNVYFILSIEVNYNVTTNSLQ